MCCVVLCSSHCQTNDDTKCGLGSKGLRLHVNGSMWDKLGSFVSMRIIGGLLWVIKGHCVSVGFIGGSIMIIVGHCGSL